MSCAEVCIDHGYDTHNEFFAQSKPVARKEWRCVECGRAIRPGQRYERSAGKAEGDLFCEQTCLVCAEIREAFVCGAWVFGMLWESIWDEMFPIWDTRGPIDCLAKLESKEARDYARTRYAEWREEFKEAPSDGKG